MKKFGLVLFAVLAALGWGGCAFDFEVPPLYGHFDQVTTRSYTGFKWTGRFSADGQSFLVNVNTWQGNPVSYDFAFASTDLESPIFQDLTAVMNGQLRYNHDHDSRYFFGAGPVGCPPPIFRTLSDSQSGFATDISYDVLLNDVARLEGHIVSQLP